ncbi:MAG: RuBisCO large subunit C-terminal-like domain-containing protein [Burkholderiaceae bacterium]|nr:RuBisCO large subunit C-terminal-like domain-containing protein [Burkholderiaceae bacterium]
MQPRLHVTYRLRTPAPQAPQRAQALALEQSIEMPVEAVRDARVLRDVVATVEHIEPQPDGTHLARLALSAESVGDDPGQLMNMLFGNSSLHSDVEVVDIALPAALATTFGGPNHGIAGVRARVKAAARPLTCTALKPIGATPAALAEMTRTFATAGIDLIKDDHGWANQASAPFESRVTACQRAVEEANATRRDGGQSLYLPSLYGHHGQMQRQIALARSHGVTSFLIAPMSCGVATFNALVREHRDCVFMAHPALAGAVKLAPPLLLGTLFRLFGADAVIFPNHGGRFAYAPQTCAGIARAARAPWPDAPIKPALPVPAGGMSVERVPEIVREYGADTVLLIGGSLLIAREQLAARSRTFVEAVVA